MSNDSEIEKLKKSVNELNKLVTELHNTNRKLTLRLKKVESLFNDSSIELNAVKNIISRILK